MRITSQFAHAAAVFAAASLFAGAVAGCSSKLETGYKPRALGSSAETRRGFYAERFTPEAHKARQYEQDYGSPAGTRRRPGE